jgi:hypothetical protein
MAKEESARNQPPDLIGDCRLMLRHSLKEGLDIPTDLQRDLAALDRELARCKLDTLSNVSNCLLGLGPDGAPIRNASGTAAPNPAAEQAQAAAPGQPPIEAGDSGTKQQTGAVPSVEATQLLYKVHGALLHVIAPATVGSLLATEPMPGKEKGVFHSMPRIVQFAALAAIVCAGSIW